MHLPAPSMSTCRHASNTEVYNLYNRHQPPIRLILSLRAMESELALTTTAYWETLGREHYPNCVEFMRMKDVFGCISQSA